MAVCPAADGGYASNETLVLTHSESFVCIEVEEIGAKMKQQKSSLKSTSIEVRITDLRTPPRLWVPFRVCSGDGLEDVCTWSCEKWEKDIKKRSLICAL